MSFREVRVFEIREVLRLWLRGDGLRSIERLAVVDRKTVRRYVQAAVELGLLRDGGEGQLTDGFMGQVCERVRPHRPDGHGSAWSLLAAHHAQLEQWLKTDGLTAVKAHELLVRQGVVRAPAHDVALRARSPRRRPFGPPVDGPGRRRRPG
jgi:hypothetical protein